VSLDLTLFPVDYLEIRQALNSKRTMVGSSRTVLQVIHHQQVHAVSKMESTELPDGHQISGLTVRHRSGLFRRDPYGAPYRWVEAGPLAKVLRESLPDPKIANPTTSYIRLLRPSNMVILGWR